MDVPIWLRTQVSIWHDLSSPTKELKAVIAAYLRSAEDDVSERLARAYFKLHDRLTSQPGFDRASASVLLSHARFAEYLAREEKLSSAQIANLIAARDKRVPVSWVQIQIILRGLKALPVIGQDEVEAIYASDVALELDVFADANQQVCNETISTMGSQLGFPGDLLGPLTILLPPGGRPFGPYLQMLHYQCTIAEKYDHALQTLYEFTPRGKAAKWLFHRYPSALEVRAENPFVNNAKGVDQLDEAWARARASEAQVILAHAFVSVIQGLDSMGFAAKRELASGIRRLLARRMRLAEGSQVELPGSLSTKQIRALLKSVATTETNTKGIVEQRLVDAVAALRNPHPKWIPRGLLDSVNATNLSSAKCGDCDFQDTANRQVQAYEAHGGRLTDVYVEGHLRSLERVIDRRAREWEENLGSADDWRVTITFVAHDCYSVRPLTTTIADVEVQVGAISFEDFLSSFDPSDRSVTDVVEVLVRRPLAEDRTPDSIRQKFLNLLGPS